MVLECSLSSRTWRLVLISLFLQSLFSTTTRGHVPFLLLRHGSHASQSGNISEAWLACLPCCFARRPSTLFWPLRRPSFSNIACHLLSYHTHTALSLISSLLVTSCPLLKMADCDAMELCNYTRANYTNKKFTDLIIRCHDKEFHVHKVIMAAYSGFFSKACDPESPWIVRPAFQKRM